METNDIFHRESTPQLNEFLTFGGYLAVIKAQDPDTKKIVLKNIYDTYVSKDVLEFLQVSDPSKYHCIVRTLAALTGKLLNYNELRKTCQNYKETKQPSLSFCFALFLLYSSLFKQVDVFVFFFHCYCSNCSL